MFERYSESARRALFFARYEAAQTGGTTIEPEHLVLGVLRDSPAAILRSAREGETAETIRGRLASAHEPTKRVSTSVEIPFSASCKDALAHTPIEADSLGNQIIRPEHIILGVLVETDGTASRAMREAGVDPRAIREYLRASPEPKEESHEGSARMVAFAPPFGAIVRQWKGVVKRGSAEEYVRHLRGETISALAEMDGFVTYSIMRRDVEDGTEFQVLTVWRSLDAIKAFAGEDVTRAVVPPAAQALMVRCDERAVHFEIVR